ncbi:MAG TPA: iron ABC transporter permease, partial [Rhizobiaceae bacterium]|nr:iron ABC transporter permease [Rhizobiaceae bacterium]
MAAPIHPGSGTAKSTLAPRVPPRVARSRLGVAMALAVALLISTPVIALFVLALGGDGADWPHLASNVLPRAFLTTMTLMALVAALTASMGVISAWLVMSFDFPGRRFLSWALVLPLAVPSYLAAYGYV